MMIQHDAAELPHLVLVELALDVRREDLRDVAELARPEGVKRAQHRIASSNRHAMTVGTKTGMVHIVCGAAWS